MSLPKALQKQQELHNNSLTADQQKAQKRPRLEGKQQQIIDDMARGKRLLDGSTPAVVKPGRPKELQPFAFGGAMYTSVAKHLFYFTRPETDDPQKIHSYFTDDHPLIDTTRSHAQIKEAKPSGPENVSTSSKKRAAGISTIVGSSAKKNRGRNNKTWSSDLKVIAVDSYLKTLKNNHLDGGDILCDAARKLMTPCVKFLKATTPGFDQLQTSHLLTWVKKYRDGDGSLGTVAEGGRAGENHAPARVHAQIKEAKPGPENTLTSSKKRAAGSSIVSSSAKKKKNQAGNKTWSSDLKVIAVDNYLKMLNRNQLDGGDILCDAARKLMTPCVKSLKATPGFDGLQTSHLLAWVKKYRDGDGSLGAVAEDGRAGENRAPARIIPPELLTEIHSLILRVTATQAEVNAPNLRPCIEKCIERYKNGKYAHLLEESKDGTIPFKVSLSWVRNQLRACGQRYRKVTNDDGKLPSYPTTT